ncbi:hypothetical protein ACFL2R_00435 [Patescibacteria group bacterium]
MSGEDFLVEIDSLEKAWIILVMSNDRLLTEPEIIEEVSRVFHVVISIPKLKRIIDEFEATLIIRSTSTKPYKDLNIKAYYLVNNHPRRVARKYLKERRIKTS